MKVIVILLLAAGILGMMMLDAKRSKNSPEKEEKEQLKKLAENAHKLEQLYQEQKINNIAAQYASTSVSAQMNDGLKRKGF